VDNKGLDLPEGNYFYQIIIKKKEGEKSNRIISGSITLIR
jgi:hypothetical protein